MNKHDDLNCINSKPCFDCEYPNKKIYFCPKCNSTMDCLIDILICSQVDCGWNIDEHDKDTLDWHGRLDNCTPKCGDLKMPHTCTKKRETPY